MSLVQILVIEDDLAIRTGICDALENAGYTATGVESGEEGLKQLHQFSFDLVLLDLVLPGLDGLRIMQAIAEAHPSQSVIMLTARGDVQDRIRGLGLGADDYVVKPFNVGELLARVQAVLRRVQAAGQQILDCLLPNGSRVDFQQRNVILCDGRTIQLAERESDLLRYLFSRRGQIVSRDELIQKVWGLNPKGLNTRTVDMHIARLRDKIGDSHDEVDWIVTIRGRGYIFLEENAN